MFPEIRQRCLAVDALLFGGFQEGFFQRREGLFKFGNKRRIRFHHLHAPGLQFRLCRSGIGIKRSAAVDRHLFAGSRIDRLLIGF